MPMSDAVKTAMVAVTPKLVWPIIALIAILLFQRPISNAIYYASSGSGAEVSMGVMKISLPKAQLPIPSAAVAQVLPELNSETRSLIASNDGHDNTPEPCYMDAGLREFQSGSATQNLVSKGMITFTKEDSTEPGGQVCIGRAKITYKPLYDEVRSYLLSVVNALQFQKT